MLRLKALLHWATIRVTCFATATAEDTRESNERFNWLMSTNHCETSCAGESLRGVLHWAMFEKIVAALPQSLRKVEPSSTFHNSCRQRKNARMTVARYVTPGNFSCNLPHNKLRDKLHEALPSVTPPLLTPCSLESDRVVK